MSLLSGQSLRALVTVLVLLGTLVASSQFAQAQNVREGLFPGGEFFQFEGRPAFILWPESKQRSEPQPWVFYAPTLPAYPDTHEEWMHRKFLAAGVAVAGVDVGEAYGSAASRKVFDGFYQQLVQHRGLAARPCLLGRSRGGLWVGSWACDHPERFSGLAGIYPVFDFRTYPGLEKTAASYEMSREQLEERLNELNPIARVDVLAKAKLPVFIIHGDEDRVVPLKENSAALAERYQMLGADKFIELEVVRGQGHNFWEGFFRCQQLVDFVIEHARQK